MPSVEILANAESWKRGAQPFFQVLRLQRQVVAPRLQHVFRRGWVCNDPWLFSADGDAYGCNTCFDAVGCATTSPGTSAFAGSWLQHVFRRGWVCNGNRLPFGTWVCNGSTSTVFNCNTCFDAVGCATTLRLAEVESAGQVATRVSTRLGVQQRTCSALCFFCLEPRMVLLQHVFRRGWVCNDWVNADS
jgi:hypothetical protein